MTIGSFARAKLVCAVAALALLATGIGAQSASAKTLRIGWTAIPSNIPLLIADQKGFFKKYGIEPKITANTASGNVLPSLGKQYDVLVATVADVLLYSAKGGDPQILASGTVDTKQTAQPNLLVAKGTNSLKELKGKTICVISVGTGQQYVSAYVALSKAGMNPKKDVKWLAVPFPNQLDAMRAGRCDAALSTQPYINQMKAAGYGGFINTLLSTYKLALGTLYVTRSSLLKKDAKTYRNFQKAYREAVAYCQANREECIDLIVKELGTNRNAANSTNFNTIRPVAQNAWIQGWVSPMVKAGLLKKGKISKKKNFVFK